MREAFDQINYSEANVGDAIFHRSSMVSTFNAFVAFCRRNARDPVSEKICYNINMFWTGWERLMDGSERKEQKQRNRRTVNMSDEDGFPTLLPAYDDRVFKLLIPNSE